MSSAKEKISVALCTYNGEDYIASQLESILNQSYPVNEIIICDDQSTDNTIKILEGYIKLYPKLIKLYQNEIKRFTIKNFERAISFTSGEIIFLSDQDDIWEPHKVERCINYFYNNKNCLMLFTNASLIDAKNKCIAGDLWRKWGFNENLREKWLDNQFQIISLIQNINKVTGATVAFHQKLKNDIIPMNLPNGVWHDCFLALNAAKYKGLHFINEKLIQYRIHDKQQVGLGGENSSNNKAAFSYEQYREYLKIEFEHYLSYFDSKYSANPMKLKKRNSLMSSIKKLLR